MQPAELTYAVDHQRYYTVRRVLLLAATHVQEHITQIVAAREDAGAGPNMPERILARAVQAQGELIAALIGLDDEALDREPAPGEWSVRQALDHTLNLQERIVGWVGAARAAAVVSERQ
jgi:hypothetical protein